MTQIIGSTTNRLQPTDDQPFTLVDLEREFTDPDGAMDCQQAIVQFKTHIAHLQVLQQSGLTPEQFAQSEMLRSALQSAVNCLSISS